MHAQRDVIPVHTKNQITKFFLCTLYITYSSAALQISLCRRIFGMEPRTEAIFASLHGQSATLTNQLDLIPKYFQLCNNKKKSPDFQNSEYYTKSSICIQQFWVFSRSTQKLKQLTEVKSACCKLADLRLNYFVHR